MSDSLCLQGLISQDVDSLAPGELRFGALLTPQGRLLFDLFLIGQAGYAPGLPLPPDEPAPSSWIMSARADIGLAF